MSGFTSAMGGIGKSMGQAITGRIESAKLIVDDYREQRPQVPSGPGLPSVASATVARLSGALPAASPGQSRCFDVQFNPSELTINVTSQPQKRADVTTRSQRRRARQTTSKDVEETQLDMTVVLYFDDMDTFDCFTGDKFSSLGSVKGITNVAKTFMNRKAKSVQPEVEALIGALRNPLTRFITFRWADFVFKGQLTAVQAKYTMFSTAGCPVRATVLLRLRHIRDDTALAGWYQDLAQAFDNNAAGKLGQKAGNLLNLNF